MMNSIILCLIMTIFIMMNVITLIVVMTSVIRLHNTHHNNTQY